MGTYWIASDASKLIAAATPVEAAEDAAPVETVEDAAAALLADEVVKECVVGTDAAEDYKAICQKLDLLPHPAITKCLATPGAVTISVRGWKADLPSLCALLIVLKAHTKFCKLKLWCAGVDTAALQLLATSLPASITTLAIEGEALPSDESALAALSTLAALPTISTLSLRCAGMSASALAALTESLTSNSSLTNLSLFGNPIGDAGVGALLAALRTNTSVSTLDLGRAGLTDATAAVVLEMVSEVAPPEAPEAGGEAADEEVAEEVGEEPIPPNTTLTALSLVHNALGTQGRAWIEAAQAASPALSRLQLDGNPCLSCGPTATMGVAPRAAIADTWAKLAEGEGGAAAVMRKAVASSLDAVAAAQPLVGYSPPVAPPPPEEGAEAAEEEPVLEGIAAIEAWEGLTPLTSQVTAAIDKLIGSLGAPEALLDRVSAPPTLLPSLAAPTHARHTHTQWSLSLPRPSPRPLPRPLPLP